MNLENLPPSWHRLRLREYLQRKKEGSEPRPRNDFIVADTISLRQTDFPPAPQGLGEMKHGAVDENRRDTERNDDRIIEQIDPKDDRWMSQDGYEYMAHGGGLTPETRQQMEDHVRKLKWDHRACVHCNSKGFCSRVYIRCGDRAQYAARESKKQQILPHHCRYVPGRHGTMALIVDHDEHFREFFRNSLVLFLQKSKVDVAVASSTDEALSVLTQCKIEGRRCGLVISEIGTAPRNGFSLANELYDRNFSTQVLLTRAKNDPKDPPSDYKGEVEIVPGRKLVRGILPKPVHSEVLIQELKKTGW